MLAQAGDNGNHPQHHLKLPRAALAQVTTVPVGLHNACSVRAATAWPASSGSWARFAIGHAPSPNGLLNEPMYAGLQKVRGGVSHTRHDPVLFTGAAAIASKPF